MIGMNFPEFVALLILSLIASVVVHYLFRYRHLEGFDGFLSKWVAGWIGAGPCRSRQPNQQNYYPRP